MAHLCTATMQNAEQYDTWKENEKKTEESIKMMNKSLRYARI